MLPLFASFNRLPPPLISLCYSHRNKREKGQSRDCDDDIIVGTRHTQEKVAPGTPGAEYKKKKQKVKRNLFRAVKFFFSLSKNFSPPVRNWSRHTFSFLYDLSLIIFFLQLCPRFIEKKIFLYLDFQPPAGCCCRILPLRPWFPPLVSPRRDSFLGRVAGSAQKKVSIDGGCGDGERRRKKDYFTCRSVSSVSTGLGSGSGSGSGLGSGSGCAASSSPPCGAW